MLEEKSVGGAVLDCLRNLVNVLDRDKDRQVVMAISAREFGEHLTLEVRVPHTIVQNQERWRNA